MLSNEQQVIELEDKLRQLGFSPATNDDRDQVSAQLGREVRGMLAVSARLKSGEAAVVLTSPRLPDNTPFPTLYYLTHPDLTAAVSGLEANGTMAELQNQLQSSEELSEKYQKAHQNYLAQREFLMNVEEIADFSAGGMPTRVKCLHALVGHSLSVGPGINPIGDLAISLLPEAIQNSIAFEQEA